MKIQELEIRTGLDRATIRYYERLNFIQPKRQENGYRDYTADDLEELLKIKLLRKLNVSLEQVSSIQEGRAYIADVLRIRLQDIEDKKVTLRKEEYVTKEIINRELSYESLNPVPYLSMLEDPVTDDQTEKSSFSEHTAPAQTHPFRRFFARWIDYCAYMMILRVIWFVLLDIRPATDWNNILLFLLGILVSVPMNALLISTWGTTFGKYIMGIRLETDEGFKVTFQNAIHREWKVLKFGYGWFIPIYSMWRAFKNYKACKTGEWMDWEEYGVELQYKDFAIKSIGISIVIISILYFISVFLTVFSQFPPNSKELLTINELAENYNAIARKDGSVLMMDSTGQLVQANDNNVILTDDEEQSYECNYELEGDCITQINYVGKWDSIFMNYHVPESFRYMVYSVAPGDYFLFRPDKTVAESLNKNITDGQIVMHDITVSWDAMITEVPTTVTSSNGEVLIVMDDKYVFEFQIQYK